jgi:peptide-methionine (S)-S-oxide reductase
MNRIAQSFSLLVAAAMVLGLAACQPSDSAEAPAVTTGQQAAGQQASAADVDPTVADTATFAGGCFWCMEPPFDRLPGVASTISGFAGGTKKNPSYREVAYGRTDHTETVQVVYDSTKVDYERLLYVYWRNVDPLDGSGQFCDRGSQYRPAIFPHTAHQRRLAEETKQEVAQRFDQPIQVEIVDYTAFYAAEDYHQNYYQKNPDDYSSYRQGCRRDARLKELWGDEANPPPKES